jgi:hypothetical protein
LKQPFFIGDGRTSSNVIQQVIPPLGATRLYLAVTDGVGWNNNTGQFNVTVNGLAGPLLAPPAVATLQMTITSDPAVPVITSSSTVFVPRNQPFSYTITFDSASAEKPLFDFNGTLPPGLTFDPNTGTISGTRTIRAMRDDTGKFLRALNDSPVVATGGLGTGNSSGTGTKPINFFEPAADPILNISTRLPVRGGDNVLIGGFIITGQDSKKVIIRGIGPSLATAGVQGSLSDPTLELHASNGTLMATNDNWRETQPEDIQATTIPPSSDLESAIVATLSPGAYTGVVAGKNSTTGIGLVEVYDLSAAATAKLANISTRGFVDLSDNVMIGGFIVGSGGSGPSRVIVRGLGPSLASSGISGVLADPTLELRDGNGGLVASNDNWKDSQQTDIQATSIPPSDERESAIVSNLNPGAYTAILRGKNSSTGVGLVELYALQ